MLVPAAAANGWGRGRCARVGDERGMGAGGCGGGRGGGGGGSKLKSV